MKRKKNSAQAEDKNAAFACKFGDPEPVLAGELYDNLGVWLIDNGRY